MQGSSKQELPGVSLRLGSEKLQCYGLVEVSSSQVPSPGRRLVIRNEKEQKDL